MKSKLSDERVLRGRPISILAHRARPAFFQDRLLRTFRSILACLAFLIAWVTAPQLGAALAPVDDFQSYDTGGVDAATGGVWTGVGTVTEIQEQDGNRYLSWGNSSSGAFRELGSESVADGETATYFFRVRSNTGNPDNSFGLTDVASPGTWGDFKVQVLLIQNSGNIQLGVRGSESSPVFHRTDLEAGVWYNVWLVVDNAANTYDLFLSEGYEDGELLAADVPYRGAAAAGNLNRFFVLGNRDLLAVGLDDLHFSVGQDTSNPIPEPVELVLLKHPESASVFVGDEVVFEASAAGGAVARQYRWEFSTDGETWTEIAGADGPSHAIASVTGDDAGHYRLVVTSGAETLVSDVATLSVSFPPPTIATGLEDALIQPGDSHTFEVVATGIGPLTYEWRKDGVILAETGNTLTVSNAQAADRGTYAVTVTDHAGVASGFGATRATTLAGLYTYDDAATVFLDAGDELGSSSFDSNLNWDDGNAPSAGKTYVVEGPLAMRTPASGESFTFGGDALVLHNGGRLMYKGTGNTGPITIGQLVLNGGSLEHQNGAGDLFEFHGNLAVQGDSAVWAKQGEINIRAVITGAGSIFNQDSSNEPSTLVFASPENTYHGSVVNNGRFRLADTGVLNFVIEASGRSNTVSGTGPQTAFNGTFRFDLTTADTEVGAAWPIVTASNAVFGETFAVADFTEYPGGIWVQDVYLFDQNTGILEVFDSSIPLFLMHPATVAGFVGEDLTLESYVLSEGDVVYQWEVSQDEGGTWTDIAGATAANLVLTEVPYSAQGWYRVRATGGGETMTSEVAEVTLSFPGPTLLQTIADVTVREGDPFSFFVLAEGLGELAYAWTKDDVALAETGNTLDLGVIEADDAGVYSVTITDSAASSEGLEPVSVTLVAELSTVDAPPVGRAIGLNFVGAASVGNPWGGSSVLGVLEPDETAGILPIANWNSSATENGVAVRTVPLFLEENDGRAAGTYVTWSSNNTWAFGPDGQPAESATGRLFHGYIETRANSPFGQSTVTFSNIPYAQYDVYVFMGGGEGAVGRVWLDDDAGSEFFFNSLAADVFPRPYIQSNATTLQEAQAGDPATFVRFSGVTEATLSIHHTEPDGGHSGGIAAIAILDTTPEGGPYPPLVTSVPSSRFVPGGTAVELSVSASSQNAGGSLSYQWTKDGVVVSTSDTLTFGSATSADSGAYAVTVTDSAIPSQPRTAEAVLIVADEAQPVLLSVDMKVGGNEPMHGHAVLRESGPVTIDANDPRNDIGRNGDVVADSTWNGLAAAAGEASYGNLVDSQGRPLSGLTVQVAGVTAVEDAPDRGGIDPLNLDDVSAPLLRDYAYVTNGDVMTVTVGGLQAFAGREVTLVVYAIGADSTVWPTTAPSDHNDISRVTLAASNNYLNQGPVDTSQAEGRDLRYNNEAFATFDAVVAGNGTLTWTIGEVPEEPGEIMNAFNGFQLRFTDRGDHVTTTPIEEWRLTHFGTVENSGAAANTADFDGDGFSNLLEYALGTDPTAAGDAGESVRIEAVDGVLSLTFDHIGDTSLRYQIEATEDLSDTWSVVETYPAFGQAGTGTYIDTESMDAPRRFLRLRVTLSAE